ncbi:MAG: substrate-binding domain-containing protein, partial [Spirochaetales bacterium]|nr:substrate-binding domain-containing protein [Spirochaetales bacterium]
LRSNGHTRIGCLSGPKDDIDCVDRYYAYRKWMDIFGLEVMEDAILNCQLSMSSSYEKMTTFLSSHEEIPTAFIGANDMVTIGAMQAVKDYGLKVPEDVSFIGFDGINLATEVAPSLTTVSVDRFTMGSVAVSYIIDRIEKKDKTETDYHKILINPVLKEGGSVSTITETSVVYRKNRKLIQ